MAKTKGKKKREEIVTAAVRHQFSSLFAPHTPPDKVNDPTFTPKYEAVLLFNNSNDVDMESLKELKALAAKEAASFFGADWRDMELRSPFRDNDVEKKTYDGYAGHTFVRVSTKFKPTIINLAGKALVMPDDVKSGDWIRCKVHAWGYDKKSDGINIGLGNVLFVKEDVAFSGGGSDAAEDFADFTAEKGEGAEDFM
jgi:hypothetical protein